MQHASQKLSQVVRKFLAVLAISVSVEKVFSKMRNIVVPPVCSPKLCVSKMIMKKYFFSNKNKLYCLLNML